MAPDRVQWPETIFDGPRPYAQPQRPQTTVLWISNLDITNLYDKLRSWEISKKVQRYEEHGHLELRKQTFYQTSTRFFYITGMSVDIEKKSETVRNAVRQSSFEAKIEKITTLKMEKNLKSLKNLRVSHPCVKMSNRQSSKSN